MALSCATLAVGEDLETQALATMLSSMNFMRSIATNGGYVGIYTQDMSKRYGEALYEEANSDQIWVQPPGTPTVGSCYLSAWRATGDQRFLDAAADVGRALCWGQRKEGGWDHLVDVSHFTPNSTRPERKSGRCTLDDDITQGALNFLYELDDVLDEQWLDESIELAHQFMIVSQFDNGAWPQWYPLIGGYHDYYTFNDNTINDCVMVMLRAHMQYGNNAYLECARRGGDFIILSQLPDPQAGWAQQYSHDMKPAWARAYEPPAVCSAVTARNVRTLIQLYAYTGDERYLSPIPRALAWLDSSRTGDNLWARMYETGTNRPIYGDRDNKVHYTLEEVSEERRNGYSWQSGWGDQAFRDYRLFREEGRDAFDIRSGRGNDDIHSPERLARIESDAADAIASMDPKGQWIDSADGMIHVADFVRKFSALSVYLEYVGEENKR